MIRSSNLAAPTQRHHFAAAIYRPGDLPLIPGEDDVVVTIEEAAAIRRKS